MPDVKSGDKVLRADGDDDAPSDEDDDSCYDMNYRIRSGERRTPWKEAIKQAPVVIRGLKLLEPRGCCRGLQNKRHEAIE